MKWSAGLWSACLAVVGCCASVLAAGPRVAVWDPVEGTTESRIQLQAAAQDRMAAWMRDGGIDVTRVTAQQISDSSSFSARQYDAVVFSGNCFPRSDIAALKRFADEGGVLIALGAEVPFLIAIEPGADGQWVLSPAQPKFAWQTTEILSHIGLQYAYKAELHDLGITHPATPLLKQYLPDAPDVRGKLASRWVTALTDKGQHGEIYPLLRSQRRDKADVPPQLYVARNGRRCVIVSVSDIYTSQARPDLWPLGGQTVLALARLAKDLHDRKVMFAPEQMAQISPDLKPLASTPLDRAATGSVEPENAQPLIRWGRFDGSGLEFGPVLAAGSPRQLAVNAPAKGFPSALAPGASIELALPTLTDGPLYLRLRGAYTATGAAIKASLGEQAILNESFVYIDSSSPGNFNKNLAGVPAEFTRIAYIPPVTAPGARLTLANPGNAPIYFDALQIERRTRPAPERTIGLGAGRGNHLPPDIARTWSTMRMSLRTNWLGAPDDPNRFARMDEQFNTIASLNPRIEPILEGTPPWAAISPERLAEAEAAQRPHTVPPDPAKYAQIVRDVIHRYGDRISLYEIWNEADIQQFWRGSQEEYITFVKMILPILRAEAPKARVMTTSLSGFNETYVRKLVDSGLLQQMDLVCFHPYAGKSPAWDMPYGLIDGQLMALGVQKEIYCNESGFPYKNAEWFQPPPQFTPEMQRDLMNVAISRLLSNGLAKLNVFNAGGDDHPYSLFDEQGRPRPAYQVFSDYVPLGQPGARRLDISFTSTDGTPLQGVYAAASSYDDGTAVVVLNPSQCDALRPRTSVNLDLGGGKWTCFYGDARYSGGKATITPAAGQKYAGFYKSVSLTPSQFPLIEVETTGAGSSWELLFKEPDGTVTSVVPRRGAGTVRVNWRNLLKRGGAGEAEVSFRIYGPTTLNAVRFLPETSAASAQTLPVRLCAPLSKAQAMKATLTAGQVDSVLAVETHEKLGQHWAELTVALHERCVIRLLPQQ